MGEPNQAKTTVNTNRFLFSPKQKNQNLEIRNHSQTVAMTFKLKTSTPKSYTVKPRMGFVEPGSRLAITVSVRPEGCERGRSFKDGFRLETRGLTDEEEQQRHRLSGEKELTDYVAGLWKKDTHQTSKFRVDSYYDESGDFGLAASPKTPAKGDEPTAAPQTALAASPATGRDGGALPQQIEQKRQVVTALRKEVERLETEREQISRDANQHQIAAEEMRSKETGGACVPLYLFVILWFLAFYAGMVLPKYLDIAELTQSLFGASE